MVTMLNLEEVRFANLAALCYACFSRAEERYKCFNRFSKYLMKDV